MDDVERGTGRGLEGGSSVTLLLFLLASFCFFPLIAVGNACAGEVNASISLSSPTRSTTVLELFLLLCGSREGPATGGLGWLDLGLLLPVGRRRSEREGRYSSGSDGGS